MRLTRRRMSWPTKPRRLNEKIAALRKQMQQYLGDGNGSPDCTGQRISLTNPDASRWLRVSRGAWAPFVERVKREEETPDNVIELTGL